MEYLIHGKGECVLHPQNLLFSEILKQNNAGMKTHYLNKKDDNTNLSKSSFAITKADEEKRLVFGWALVSARSDGEKIIDSQGDIVEQDDLEEGAYEYVLNFRDAGEEHIGSLRKKARMVESVVLTEEKMRAMGIPAGTVPVGWWIGFYVDDDATWEQIKNGTYKMFSIEGKAMREPVKEPVTKSVAKAFRDIFKFNDNHDELGRFAPKGGGSAASTASSGLSQEHQEIARLLAENSTESIKQAAELRTKNKLSIFSQQWKDIKAEAERIKSENPEQKKEPAKPKRELPKKPQKETDNEEDYRMSHRPDKYGHGFDITSEEAVGADFYKNPRLYGVNLNDKAHSESFEAIKRIHNKPDAEVTIYRASPKNEFNEGDWITLSPTYAKTHAESQSRGNTKLEVHSMKVKAKDIQFAGDDINEFGYFPTNKSFGVSKSFSEILKFNPYHDRLGRFSTSGGATSFTYRPGASRAHDLAIERKKKKHEQFMPTDAQAKTLKGIENRTRNLKKEQLRVVDRDGNVIMQKQGDRGSVSYSLGEARDHFPGNITIHNHPDGGTFSSADLSDFGCSATEIRAASPEGTYVMRNFRYKEKWESGQKTWLEMQEDIESASKDFKSSFLLKKEIRASFTEDQAKIDEIAQKWLNAKGSGANQETLDRYYKEYEDVASALMSKVESATRKAYTGQYHEWYKKHSAEYGFEYEFIPVKTRTAKSFYEYDMITNDNKIRKSDDDIVLDEKMNRDIAELTDSIMDELIGSSAAVRAMKSYGEGVMKANEDNGEDEIILDRDTNALENKAFKEWLNKHKISQDVAKSFSDIIKFNPYHGADGRFTGPGTAASFTYAPGKSKAHDLAIQREKERTKNSAKFGGEGSNSDKKDNIKTMEQKLEQLGRNMAETAQYAISGRNYDDSKAAKFYELKRQYDDLRSKINAKKDEEAKKRPETKHEHRTFVNGYGEATQRHITSSTYERAQRRLNRDIDRRFGISKHMTFGQDVAKSFSDIIKFNPYHDSKGRFATSSGYASFTIRTKDPGKQHMADMAVAREKERAAAAGVSTKPEEGAFIPAKTRTEAVQYAKDKLGIEYPNYGRNVDIDAVNHINQEITEIYKKYPELKGTVTNIVPETRDGVYAAAGTGYSGKCTLYIGKKYGEGIESLKEDYQKDVESGFHVPDTDYKALIWHEYGHITAYSHIKKDLGFAVEDTLGYYDGVEYEGRVKNRLFEKAALRDAAKSLKITQKELKGRISRYAEKNPSETFAEAFAEFNCSPNPRPECIALMKAAGILQ